MKNTFYLIILLFSTAIFAQTTIEKVRSERLDSERQITVKLPASYAESKDKKYPLVLVMDSQFLFAPFEGNLIYGNYWDDMPEVILVGITQEKEQRYEDTEFDESTGLPIKKGGKFFEFIGAELLPYLDTKYRIAPFKVVAGLDSTAGLINAFLYKEGIQFNAYISLSPELATSMEERIPQRLSEIKEPLFYYQATADGDLKKFQSQIKNLDKNIQALKNPLLKYKFDDFKGASHYSLVANAIPSALYHIFAVYQPITNTEFQEKLVKMPSEHAAYLKEKYELIEKWFGLKMNVRLNDFRAIEAAILKTEDYKGFEELAQISGQQFPKAMLYDYHMGMYYEKTGDLKKAIRNYQNAFSKQEIGDLTKKMMLDRSEDLKRQLPAKGKGKKEEEIIPEETPTEEKKPE